MSSYNWRAVALPEAIAALPKTAQGYPIPFTAYRDPETGAPDFRVLDVEKQLYCASARRCGICGRPLDYWAAALGGILVQENRVISDPFMHEACAEYSAQVCPYLARENAHWSNRPIPERQPGHALIVDDDGMYPRQAVMLMLFANTWQVIPAHGSGTYYLQVARWHPDKTRYFANGLEVTKQQADALMLEAPLDEQTVSTLTMAREQNADQRLRGKLLETIDEITRARLRFSRR